MRIPCMWTSRLTLVLYVGLLAQVSAFPAYQSLAGLSERQMESIIPGLSVIHPEPPPGPLAFNGTKLVNDAAHPWRPPRPLVDHRGPCPGLNTLASHGYLPRTGIATPSQIVDAVQEGFNMENTLAIFVTYAAMLVDGNPITNLMSIGGKTAQTGMPVPPPPAIVGGLNTHAVFEGDTSMTRGDFYFGDNHSFNQTRYDRLVEFSNRYGGGFYNLTVASELRWELIQQSIATNPQFSFVAPRYVTAFAESVFPLNFFVDSRDPPLRMNMNAAESFFKYGRYPPDFHRMSAPGGTTGIQFMLSQPGKVILPGANANNKVNNHVLDPTSADFNSFCLLYENFVNKTVKSLYPNPKGLVKENLKKNLEFFFSGILDPRCTQVFPYGR